MTRDQLTHALDLLHRQPARPHAPRHGRSGTEERKSTKGETTGAGRQLAFHRRRMRQIEDALIAAVLDDHPNATLALERLLEDLETEDSVKAPANRRPAPGDYMESERIEERLVGLILDRHPHREAAFERLASELGWTVKATPSPCNDASEHEAEDPERWSGLE